MRHKTKYVILSEESTPPYTYKIRVVQNHNSRPSPICGRSRAYFKCANALISYSVIQLFKLFSYSSYSVIQVI